MFSSQREKQVAHRDPSSFSYHGKSHTRKRASKSKPEECAPAELISSPLRKPPRKGFAEYRRHSHVQEGVFHWYYARTWYPVRVGALFKERYQVLGKLLYGSCSTIWLCRNLCNGHRYVTLKVFVRGYRQARQEPKISVHLETEISDHPGGKSIRLSCDAFEAQRKDIWIEKRYKCLVFEPLGMSLIDLCQISGGRIEADVLKPIVRSILETLDFLHTEAGVVHTDVQGGNILFKTQDDTVFENFEKNQCANPPGRTKRRCYEFRYLKSLLCISQRALFDSRDVPQDVKDLGSPVLGDFGDAVVGADTYGAHVMPDLYRAPELITRIEWDEKVDIWGLAMTIWDAIEGKQLFKDKEPDRFKSDGEHLAMTVALLGLPSKEFSQIGANSEEYFDEEGNWKSDIKIPNTSLEEEEKVVQGEERDNFLSFMRRILQWDSEDRPSARELLDDSWLSIEPPCVDQTGEEERKPGEP
ncbi:kinase-like domain-containing protein [Phyllosticta citrichinensis]|uniref:non-specific serine/threonine protein kinase n=1 Tax=Phyllosticta citrichinensis TaxID=1130410 RepID=A0ABR1Y206_9PEZI